ncbi:30677_t:CDS:1, partial [Gigaspora margarita]
TLTTSSKSDGSTEESNTDKSNIEEGFISSSTDPQTQKNTNEPHLP